tara:strand:+ start:214 stop:357 length:144 start_codon:yes stop_codon:yes gene_type:complete
MKIIYHLIISLIYNALLDSQGVDFLIVPAQAPIGGLGMFFALGVTVP